ncbi:hypothetical protein [Peribacillus muralis]|uniref:hypothetical protein n=1 Tax=Peribacillus muralis TaxID=264697 RepID=UPI00070BAB83|nr:hypothetical protein [Peribacillus muralis]
MKENQVLKKNRRGTQYIEANGEIIAKRCSGCGEMIELENFSKSNAGLGGTISKCRPCIVEYNKKFSEKKPEYDKRYYEKNRKGTEAKKESDKRYYEKNKGKIIESRKRYYQENKERVLERAKESYLRNKREVNEK